MELLLKLNNLLAAECDPWSFKVGVWHQGAITSSLRHDFFLLLKIVCWLPRTGIWRIGWRCSLAGTRVWRLDLPIYLHPGEHTVHLCHAWVGCWWVVSRPVFIASRCLPGAGWNCQVRNLWFIQASWLLLPFILLIELRTSSWFSTWCASRRIVVLVRKGCLNLWCQGPVVVVVVVAVACTTGWCLRILNVVVKIRSMVGLNFGCFTCRCHFKVMSATSSITMFFDLTLMRETIKLMVNLVQNLKRNIFAGLTWLRAHTQSDRCARSARFSAHLPEQLFS